MTTNCMVVVYYIAGQENNIFFAVTPMNYNNNMVQPVWATILRESYEILALGSISYSCLLE